MELKTLFKASAIATALVLAGCGGDINITEGSIDNSTSNSNNTTNNNTGGGTDGGTGGGNTPTFPGTPNGELSTAVSNALGTTVQVQTISDVITEDTTLIAGAMYALSGPVFVGNDKADSATLTIEPGVIVFGQTGNDYLVVSRDSQINASGTEAEPVIMTSLQDVVGDVTGAGQWGGLVLLGNAPSNKCPDDGSDCALQVEGVQEGAVFGGTDETDNSGTLEYVVVKFAGFEIAPDNELNGVTFGGVGSGTTVDYLQVHANADDGVEFFGGNVNVKHLVLTGNQDDSVDWDNGYRGKMQWVYIEHDKNSGDANRGIEADNDGSTPDKEPQSNPSISNLTVIGNNFDGDDDSEGVYLREGTGAQIYNMVITGPTEMGECLEVEDVAESQANLQDGTITISNSIMACTNGENFKNADSAVDLENWFLNTQTGNSVSESVMLASDGSPMSGSPLLGTGMDASTVDGFFTVTDYIGAVGTNDWRQGWAFGFGGGVVTAEAPVVGCPTGTTPISPVNGQTTCQISGTITSDVTLTNNNIYALSGPVFVGADKANSATLNIQAGVTIFGRTGNDYLVVSRDSQINAQGTASSPIIMTSAADVNGENSADGVFAGQWGGLVLLGNAPSNKCPDDGSDCALQVEGVQEGAVFGGTDSEDNSGTLRYVVVKHAGFEIAPDNELNGVTFGGVGSNTTVEYLQVHQNADDGVEFFGGSVNVKYLVLTGNQDDSIDWDNGYQGKIQHVIIQHATDDSDANRAFEADNDGSTPDKQPQSNPIVANVTIIGNNFDGDDDSEGVYLREGTGAQLSNFVITGPADMGECFEVEDVAESQANLADGTITFTNSVIACENGENFKNADGATDLEAWFLGQDSTAVAADRATVLNGIFTIFSDVPAKDFSGDAFFDNVGYIGGVSENSNWTAGWTVGLD